MGFLHNPQRLWWRKAIFQIHLWIGIALCLYLVVIGITGSILVFESEIEHAAYPQLWRAPAPSGSRGDTHVDLADVVATVKSAYPGRAITAAYVPDKPGDNFEVFLYRGGHSLYAFVDPTSGRIVGTLDPDNSWLIWIINLHFRLLAGHTGLILNGIGAAGLLLLCLTGLIVWWVGIGRWTRGLTINLRAGWKRINFDLHSAAGFWTLAIVCMWAFTGIYFVWPHPIESAVNHFSSIASARPPVFTIAPRQSDTRWAELRPMIQQAQQSSPNASFAGAFFPLDSKRALTLLMARSEMRNFSHMDYVYFDPVSGRQLAIWHRGINSTWGASFIFWLSPLHFGMDWGLLIKILWAILGCSLSLLSITGILMYWNRSLSKQWSKFHKQTRTLLETGSTIDSL